MVSKETWDEWLREMQEAENAPKPHAEWFEAIGSGDISAVAAMLDQGTEVDACSEGKVTALMRAVTMRHLPLVRLLLDHGAQPNREDSEGESAMSSLVWSDSWREDQDSREILSHLVAAGGRFGLREAVYMNDLELARQRLEEGADPNTGQSKWHGPLLKIAAGRGHLEMVELLLDSGAEIHGCDDLGGHPLLAAASRGQAEVVACLLDRGADIDGQDWFPRSPLAVAAVDDHREVVALLLARGAKRGLVDAVALGDEALVREQLEEFGEYDDLDRVYCGGLQACCGGSSHLPRFAVSRGNLEIVRMLLDRGASLHVERDNRSLLAEAARCGHVEIARLLIDRGADLHDAGDEGLTPLDWARKEGHDEMIALLERAGATR